jgi:hypothetical protein
VARVYPLDVNAALECLLSGGLERTPTPPPPVSVKPSEVKAAQRAASSAPTSGTTSTTTASASAAATSSAASSSSGVARRATSADVLFELQKLFASLELSMDRATSTRALTDAFGCVVQCSAYLTETGARRWMAGQAAQQHDVHELNRMLLDVIEVAPACRVAVC